MNNFTPNDEEWDENYEEEDEEEEDEEEDEEDEVYQCRICGAKFTYVDGDDYILICDKCAENYNLDQIYADFDLGELSKEDLKTVDLSKYKYDD